MGMEGNQAADRQAQGATVESSRRHGYIEAVFSLITITHHRHFTSDRTTVLWEYL